jgi:hypothetical protein
MASASSTVQHGNVPLALALVLEILVQIYAMQRRRHAIEYEAAIGIEAHLPHTDVAGDGVDNGAAPVAQLNHQPVQIGSATPCQRCARRSGSDSWRSLCAPDASSAGVEARATAWPRASSKRIASVFRPAVAEPLRSLTSTPRSALPFGAMPLELRQRLLSAPHRR